MIKISTTLKNISSTFIVTLILSLSLVNQAYSQTTNIIDISAGQGYSLALKSDGTVLAWGRNSRGQLGDGSWLNRSFPVQVSDLQDVIQIVAGQSMSLALSKDGTLWGWGFFNSKQHNKPIQIPLSYSLDPDMLKNVKKIYSGLNTRFAIKSDDTIWAWGSNSYHQLGMRKQEYVDYPTNIIKPYDKSYSDIVDFALGVDYTLALKKDGTVWGWGRNSFDQLGQNVQSTSEGIVMEPVQVYDLKDVIKIATDDKYSLVLKRDGTVWQWGKQSIYDSYKVAPVQIKGLSDVQEIALSKSLSSEDEEFALALKKDGTVWSWNKKIFVGSDGEVNQNLTISQIIELKNIIKIQSKVGHVLALQDDGTIWSWGRNDSGQLGDGTSIDRNAPIKVDDFLGFLDTTNHWAEKDIDYLTSRQLVSGFQNGNFRPDELVTRAEFSIIIRKALNLGINIKHNEFTDISYKYWAYPYIETVYNAGIMKGYKDLSFRPDIPLTRAELASILIRAYKLTNKENPKIFNDVSSKYWASKEIEIASSNNIIMGYADGSFKPEEFITRSQIVSMISRVLQLQYNQSSEILFLVKKYQEYGYCFDTSINYLLTNNNYSEQELITAFINCIYEGWIEAKGTYYNFIIAGDLLNIENLYLKPEKLNEFTWSITKKGKEFIESKKLN